MKINKFLIASGLFLLLAFLATKGRVYFLPLEIAEFKTCSTNHKGSLYFESYKPASMFPAVFIKVSDMQGKTLIKEAFFSDYTVSSNLQDVFCDGTKLAWYHTEEGFRSIDFMKQEKALISAEDTNALISQGFHKVDYIFKNGFKQEGWFAR